MSLRASRATVLTFVTFATFTDIVAYSIAVPVLPDLSRRLGASPTMIGFLFASFGVTLLTVSMPSGALSDRIGRKPPLVGGMILLALASLLFAFATTLPWLFAARLAQGAADAITWVVGFALIADVYPSESRGRITGIVMMGTSFAFMIGPSLGGWLYELGGIRLPFLAVAGMAAIAAVSFAWLAIPSLHADRDHVPVALVVRVPAIALCASAVLAISSTISMLEPVLALHLRGLGVNPARIGLVYGVAAVVTTLLHPIYGHAADRWGARRLTMIGLALAGCTLPLLSRASSFRSAVALFVVQASCAAMAITPSLAFMGEATSQAGVQSFGVAYGLYNLAWGAGLLSGPALGGFLFERIGFTALATVWGPLLVAIAVVLSRVQSAPRRTSMKSVAMTVALVGLVAAAGAQQPDMSQVQIKTNKIAGNFYTLDGQGGTIGVLTGADGVLMVDAQFAPLSDKIVAAIKQISDGRIRFLVNTHVHGDHTGGNENIAKTGATILARANLRARLMKPAPAANGQPTPPAPQAALPILTYDSPIVLHMNGEEVQLIPVPVAHTDGDTMVYFPNANALMTGDFYRSTGYPNIDRANGGTMNGMLAGFDLIARTGRADTKIIPGHGAIVDKAAVAAHKAMMIAVRDKVAALVRQNKTQDEVVAAKPTAEFDSTVTGATPQTADRFVGQLYQEIKQSR